jgi:hypothetical protein
MNGYLQAYGRDVEIMSMGRKGCLVVYKTGVISGSFIPVTYDSISWKSHDWYETDRVRKEGKE